MYNNGISPGPYDGCDVDALISRSERSHFPLAIRVSLGWGSLLADASSDPSSEAAAEVSPLKDTVGDVTGAGSVDVTPDAAAPVVTVADAPTPEPSPEFPDRAQAVSPHTIMATTNSSTTSAATLRRM
ncbi:hypothetical protein [Corynebacterium sp. CNCTC7651]|uniref:hypothetical protein n=1 Tax=Corynebacterium sp. CNCTC7651 TaxID=2815361 RepID=UPI00351D35CD